MAHAHESNLKRIWTVFGILSVITTVEVYFGITKPESLFLGTFISMWAFMHLEGEKKSLRWSVVAPLVFLILYLCFIILVEADYIFEVFKNSHYKWIF
jgi:cytochrome c oxidase subunit IV